MGKNEKERDSLEQVLEVRQKPGADRLLFLFSDSDGEFVHFIDEKVEIDESQKALRQSCRALVFKEVNEWDDASLEIRWDSEKKEFTVTFKGEGMVNLPIENLLSKAVPLHIASSSNCECGENLQLGDYRILTTRNDFSFEGIFFCVQCKAKILAERSGLRHFIATWFKGLKKVQVNATGVGIERE
jgi:hypothetical protein